MKIRTQQAEFAATAHERLCKGSDVGASMPEDLVESDAIVRKEVEPKLLAVSAFDSVQDAGGVTWAGSDAGHKVDIGNTGESGKIGDGWGDVSSFFGCHDCCNKVGDRVSVFRR